MQWFDLLFLGAIMAFVFMTIIEISERDPFLTLGLLIMCLLPIWLIFGG